MEMSTAYVAINDLGLVSDRLSYLINKGYHYKFRKEPDCIYCFDLDIHIRPGQFNVDESWFFEDVSEPDINRMLYAISTDTGMKGVLADSYGVYADNMSHEMIEKLGRREVKAPAIENISANS